MWKILGTEAMYVEFANVFKKRILELAAEIENGQKFIDIVSESDVTYLMNGSTETHAFTIRPDKNLSPEDIQYLADIILAIAKSNLDRPVVSLDDNYQKCIVNVRTDEEPELLGKDRTEGYASGKIFMPILESFCKPGRANESML